MVGASLFKYHSIDVKYAFGYSNVAHASNKCHQSSITAAPPTRPILTDLPGGQDSRLLTLVFMTINDKEF